MGKGAWVIAKCAQPVMHRLSPQVSYTEWESLEASRRAITNFLNFTSCRRYCCSPSSRHSPSPTVGNATLAGYMSPSYPRHLGVNFWVNLCNVHCAPNLKTPRVWPWSSGLAVNQLEYIRQSDVSQAFAGFLEPAAKPPDSGTLTLNAHTL